MCKPWYSLSIPLNFTLESWNPELVTVFRKCSCGHFRYCIEDRHGRSQHAQMYRWVTDLKRPWLSFHLEAVTENLCEYCGGPSVLRSDFLRTKECVKSTWTLWSPSAPRTTTSQWDAVFSRCNLSSDSSNFSMVHNFFSALIFYNFLTLSWNDAIVGEWIRWFITLATEVVLSFGKLTLC